MSHISVYLHLNKNVRLYSNLLSYLCHCGTEKGHRDRTMVQFAV